MLRDVFSIIKKPNKSTIMYTCSRTFSSFIKHYGAYFDAMPIYAYSQDTKKSSRVPEVDE